MAARHVGHYQRSRRLIGIVVALALLAAAGIAAYRLRPVSATSMPLSGVAMVTGYGVVSSGGQSREPTTVVLTSVQARSVARAISELPSLGHGATFFCHAQTTDFLVRVMRARGERPYWTARDLLCPSPGYLLINGRGATQSLGSVCALRQLVVSMLPRGTALGTRSALRLCPASAR
ncbi:MAG TPA: hypothetical protein VLS91_01080 [Acidimicrobiales bacterium]|nr:hypothetical protein [Acidimicrobiales bacterium]